uniref:TF-B3 domain-containing protein n=1 Tax=Triticum urartu TaxID=4572 RepID=A0A8R7UVI5_TRIUA
MTSQSTSAEHLVGSSTSKSLKIIVTGVMRLSSMNTRLADARLRVECRIMLGTDKKATITTSWSEFRRRANIREGDICAFHFRVTSKRRVFSPCTASRSTIEDTAVPV